MHIPLKTFYLLRVLYLEQQHKKNTDYVSIGDFAFGALLCPAIPRADFGSLADDKKTCLKSYRLAAMMAKIVPPRLIADREFVLQEYVALQENVTLIPIETDFTDEKVSFDAESLTALHNSLEALLLPILQLSDKRAREGVPSDY